MADLDLIQHLDFDLECQIACRVHVSHTADFVLELTCGCMLLACRRSAFTLACHSQKRPLPCDLCFDFFHIRDRWLIRRPEGTQCE